MKKKIIKNNLFIICVCLAIFFILFILGNIKRVGYLSDILLNIEETLNNNSIHTNRLNINDIEEYILTNDMITNYVYNFRISYYSKVFRNSDIYGVYLNTNSLPDYVKNIRFDEIGSPFGILVGSKIIKDKKIDDIEYSLKIKYHIFIIIIISIYLCFILFCNFSFIIFDFIKLIYNIKSLKKINLKNKYVYILIMFLCFLIMPNIIYKVFYAKFDHTNYENRRFADKPKFEVKKLNEYPQLYENYFKDYIPFKNELVKLNNLIDIVFFKNILNINVTLGKSDWLFFKLHLLPIFIDEKYYETAKDNLLNFRNKFNIDNFYLMVCPNKTIIYDNYLPDFINTKYILNDSLEKFIKYLEKNTDIRIIYPKNELLRYRDKYQLYYKYDMHWNSLGAYIGFNNIKKYLGLTYSQIENLSINKEKNINMDNIYPYNDLAKLLSLNKLKNYNNDYVYHISNYNQNYTIEYKHDNYKFKYKSNFPKYDKNILIIRDSYTLDMEKYLGNEFKNFISYGYRDTNIYISNKVDIVIFETIDQLLKQRMLNLIPQYNVIYNTN